MDNKQAAATLRETATWITPPKDEAAVIGADAIEMLEWLFQEIDSYGRFRFKALYDEWKGEDSFRAYCEARFRERAR